MSILTSIAQILASSLFQQFSLRSLVSRSFCGTFSLPRLSRWCSSHASTSYTAAYLTAKEATGGHERPMVYIKDSERTQYRRQKYWKEASLFIYIPSTILKHSKVFTSVQMANSPWRNARSRMPQHMIPQRFDASSAKRGDIWAHIREGFVSCSLFDLMPLTLRL